MANRLTKGKALIGSLDVQGELTVNGAPVGSGGSTNNNPPMVYTAWLSTDSMYGNESWYFGMGYFSILNNGEVYGFPRSAYQRDFVTNNNIVAGNTFDVEVEYWDAVNATYRPLAQHPNGFGVYTYYAWAEYDMMNMGTVIRISSVGQGPYGSVTPRITLRKRG